VIDARAGAQQAVIPFGLPVKLDLTVRGVEDVLHFLPRRALDPEQMPVQQLGGTFLHEPGTIGGVLRPRNNACEVGKGSIDDRQLWA
jgi:hypothetical protein